MTISEKLTDIGYGIAAGPIPDSSYDAAIKFLIDTIGCAIGGHAEPGIKEIMAITVDWGGRPEASVFFSDIKLPLPNAAFVNSGMIHALDLDDIYIPGTLHISSTLVPVVWAVAEKLNVSGKRMLDALIAGVEVACRLGMAEKYLRRDQNFLPSSLVNGFGATVAAAILYGMSREECVNALGINYAQVSGNRQALIDMSLTKRLQPAFAARSALWSVELAKRGITGPVNAFEGRYGYCSTYLNGENIDPDELLLELDNLQIEKISTKKYPSCGACHNVQIAAERLREEENISADDIEKIMIFNCGPGGLVGNPFKIGSNPQVDAQFSVIWAVAHTMVRGPVNLDSYRSENVANDHEVINFIRKISFCDAPEKLPAPPQETNGLPLYNFKFQGLIVHTKDGRTLQREQAPFQTFETRNYSLEMTIGKFKDCVDFAGLSDKLNTDEVIGRLLSLPEAAQLEPLPAVNPFSL